jgi:hypothetical protein
MYAIGPSERQGAVGISLGAGFVALDGAGGGKTQLGCPPEYSIVVANLMRDAQTGRSLHRRAIKRCQNAADFLLRESRASRQSAALSAKVMVGIALIEDHAETAHYLAP